MMDTDFEQWDVINCANDHGVSIALVTELRPEYYYIFYIQNNHPLWPDVKIATLNKKDAIDYGWYKAGRIVFDDGFEIAT